MDYPIFHPQKYPGAMMPVPHFHLHSHPAQYNKPT